MRGQLSVTMSGSGRRKTFINITFSDVITLAALQGQPACRAIARVSSVLSGAYRWIRKLSSSNDL